MRRTTLGGLSPSQLNSRGSQGPGRIAHGQGTKKRITLGPGSRPSLGRAQPDTSSMLSTGVNRGSLSRRSSMYGKGSSGTRTDPRPVTDKSYQANCIRTLITYLTVHGYDHAISPKLLQTPTSKEFLHMTQFLFKKVDPNIKFGAKIEEEVPALFKGLGYPFQISKSALYAVGSPHAWPSLLAALTWVVELLNYEERAEEAKASGASFDDNGHNAQFFDYVNRAYNLYLNGDDSNCQLLDEQLAQSFRIRDQEIIQEIDQLEQVNQRLAAELEDVRSQPSPLVALESQRADFVRDIGKLNANLSAVRQRRQASEKQLELRRQELVAREAELAALSQEVQGLRERVAAQEVNREDVERMMREKKKVEDILQVVTMQKEQLERSVLGLEVESSRGLEKLEATLRLYHTTGDRLKVIPASAKRAEGVVFEIEVNSRASRAEDIVSVDLKGVIKPALVQLRDAYSRRLREAQQARLAAEEQLRASEETFAEEKEAHTVLESRLRKLEDAFRVKREALDAEMSTMEGELQRLEEDIGQMKSLSTTTVHEAEELLRTMQKDAEEELAKKELEREAMGRDLMQGLEAAMHHKGEMTRTLQRLEQLTCQSLKDLQAAVA